MRWTAYCFRTQYQKPAMFLPRAIISCGLSQLMILSALSWSWNRVAFECGIYYSLQMYVVPSIVTGNLVFKLLKIEFLPKQQNISWFSFSDTLFWAPETVGQFWLMWPGSLQVNIAFLSQDNCLLHGCSTHIWCISLVLSPCYQAHPVPCAMYWWI